MFHTDLRKASKTQNRAAVCQLIHSIPADCWIYPGDPWAETTYDSVKITAHRFPRDPGLNAFDIVHLDAIWPSGTRDSLGSYRAEELKVPCYPSM